MEKQSQVIPRGYNGESAVTPIFLVTVDQNGNVINPALIQAVEAQHRALCGMAKTYLDDPARVSDLAQAALNRVWARQLRGVDLDKDANVLIYGAARLIGRAWRYRERKESERWLSFSAVAHFRSCRSAIEDEYIEKLDGDAIIAGLMKDLSAIDRRIIDLHLLGLNYVEIVAALRNENGISRHRVGVSSVVKTFHQRATSIT